MGKLPKQPSNEKRMETGNRRQKDVDNGKAKKKEKQKQKEFFTQKEFLRRRKLAIGGRRISAMGRSSRKRKPRRSVGRPGQVRSCRPWEAFPAAPLRRTTVSNIQTPNPNIQGHRGETKLKTITVKVS